MRGKFGEHQTVRSILKSLPRTVHDDVTRAGIGEMTMPGSCCVMGVAETPAQLKA